MALEAQDNKETRDIINLAFHRRIPEVVTLNDMEVGDVAVILESATDEPYQGQLILKIAEGKDRQHGIFKSLGHRNLGRASTRAVPCPFFLLCKNKFIVFSKVRPLNVI